MKSFKQSLHIWITSASLVAFLTGWGFLAHTPKTIVTTATNNASTPTIAAKTSPLQFIQKLLNIQPQSRNHSRPNSTNTLRSGGS